MRRVLAVSVSFLLAGALAGCNDSSGPTSASQPSDLSASQQGGVVVEEEAPLLAQPGTNFPPIVGSVTLTRNTRNGTLNWRLEATGVRPGAALEPGNAFTVWVGNFTQGPADGGWGSGGVVGGSGSVTTGGNHCVWDLITFWDGGFRPGEKPNCERVRLDEPMAIFLLDHGEWEPGDMLERWDPDGDPTTRDAPGECDGSEDECDIVGAYGAFFGPAN